jgi:hypothetical protein
MQWKLFVIGLSLACRAAAQPSNGLLHPESVISDGHFLYVTDLGKELAPSAKDSDGAIRKLSLQGTLLNANITTATLHAPKGTGIIRGILYTADVDHVVGIELASGKKVADISLDAWRTALLNDIAVKDEHTLFVSATDIGKVFEVNLQTKQVQALDVDIKGANGICYDKAQRLLYTCSFDFENMQGGEIGVISWASGKPAYRKATAVKGAFDGLELLNQHTLLVSDWGSLNHATGVLKKIDLNNHSVTSLKIPLIGGPADFCLQNHRLFIPAMLEARLIIQSL